MGLYDLDFHAWAEQQADAVRRRSANEVDWENVAEEIEGLGKQERAELYSHLRVLLIHLLKWEFQPQRRSRSWALSMVEQRAQLERHLALNPSLGPHVHAELSAAHKAARARAARETGLPLSAFPEQLPYSAEDVLRDGWTPGGEPFPDL